MALSPTEMFVNNRDHTIVDDSNLTLEGTSQHRICQISGFVKAKVVGCRLCGVL